MATPLAVIPSQSEDAHPTVDYALHPSGIIPTLQNIVSTVNLGCALDLKKIALKARNAEYNPKVSYCPYFTSVTPLNVHLKDEGAKSPGTFVCRSPNA